MKKHIVFFSLFMFSFSFSHAQDTIFFQNGQKQAVKIISVTDFISYTVPPSVNPMTMQLSGIAYIKYSDGFIYTVNRGKTEDKKKVMWKPYILIAGGADIPLGNGYGGTTLMYDPYTYYYSTYQGFAGIGTAFSATAGLQIYNGWEITGMFSYIHNPFDGGQLGNEINDLFLNNGSYYTNAFSINYDNYSYTNYAGLLGITKNWEGKEGGVGFSVMGGILENTLPTIYGAINLTSYSNGIPMGQSYYLTLDEESQTNFVFAVSLHGDANITRHIFIRLLTEFLFSSTAPGGNYQLQNINTGAVTTNGYSGAETNYSTSPFKVMNATIGLGYKF